MSTSLADPTNPRSPQVTDPSEAQCPPLSWLGYSLNILSVTPFDISVVLASVLKPFRLFKIDPGITSQTFSSGVTWDVPQNIDASEDVSEAHGNFISFEKGSDATVAFETNVNLQVTYMAVSGGASTSYAITKTFSDSYSYALFDFNQTLIQASVDNWADYIAEDKLVKQLTTLPHWDTSNATINQYRNFFEVTGTHVITGTTYGGRFQLMSWASNSNSSVASEFAVDVNAQYNGLVGGGQFNAGVKTSTEYYEYLKTSGAQYSCKGGNGTLAGKVLGGIEANDVYANYVAWTDSSRTSPAVVSLQLEPIWNVVAEASDDTISSREKDIKDAYDYIASHPANHITQCRLIVNSDWGQFDLLSPGVCQDGPGTHTPGYGITSTKVGWSENGVFGQNATVDFEIVNDGSPIDFELSHGSLSSTGSAGSCTVYINGTEYDNSGDTDNVRNAKYFYRIAVNPNESAS